MNNSEISTTINSASELQKAYRDGRRDFTGANLTDAHLFGADLTDAYFTGANLTDAYLLGATLRYAKLEGADLEGADLGYAYLSETSFTGANLAKANLTKADLRYATLRYANLTKANLTKADLRYTNLKGAILTDAKLDYQIEEGLLEKIAHLVLADHEKLNMEEWHSCNTCHCLAGWAVILAEKGKELEARFETANAGLLLLGEEAHRYFYSSDAEVLTWLETKISQ